MKTKLLSLLGMVILLSPVLHAQFTEDALRFASPGRGVSSRALGMGNAYIGVADDFSATYWNPAGLAQMRRIEMTGGITNFNYKNSAELLGVTIDETQTSTKLDNIGFALPFPTTQGSFVLAFGYNRAADYTRGLAFDAFNPHSSIINSNTLYDADENFDIPFQTYLVDQNGYTAVKNNVQQTGTVKESGGLGNWAFAGAMDVAKDVSFGATLNILNGSYSFEREFIEADTRNVYNNTRAGLPADSASLRFNKFYLNNSIEDDISGVNLLVGMMYRSDRVRVGLTIKTPTAVTIKEKYTDAGESFFDKTNDNNFNPGPRTHSYDAENEYGVLTPWTFGAGVSVEPIYGLLLAGDVDYTDWTQLEWTDNKVLERENSSMQKSLRAVLNIRLGAEYEIPGTDLRVRAGYMNQPSQYKGDPSSYDASTFTGGAGILLQDNVLLDLGVALGSFKTHHTNYDPIDEAVKFSTRTNESVSTTRVNFTISYRF